MVSVGERTTPSPGWRAGRTTIVISHRFPTVRMAKRIIVLEKGEIVESGSHESLLATGGQYVLS